MGQDGMEKKQIVGYTTGVFDLFHIGHLNVIRRSSELCYKLIVGVTTDELCFSRKSKIPIIPFPERIAIVESIRYVDRVVPQENMAKLEAWEKLRFDRIFVGDDWKGSTAWARYEADFAKVGVEVFYLPYTETTSSTLLREKIEKL